MQKRMQSYKDPWGKRGRGRPLIASNADSQNQPCEPTEILLAPKNVRIEEHPVFYIQK